MTVAGGRAAAAACCPAADALAAVVALLAAATYCSCCLRCLLLPRAAARCFGAQPADAASAYCCHLVVAATHTSTYCCFLLPLLMSLMFFAAPARYHRWLLLQLASVVALAMAERPCAVHVCAQAVRLAVPLAGHVQSSLD